MCSEVFYKYLEWQQRERCGSFAMNAICGNSDSAISEIRLQALPKTVDFLFLIRQICLLLNRSYQLQMEMLPDADLCISVISNELLSSDILWG